MIEIRGTYASALCYCDAIDESSRRQIEEMCGLRIFGGAHIRIMPDVHIGVGCTIGTTMIVGKRASPGLVGVDIGCGMETVKLKDKSIDFDRLDQVIRKNIPAGQSVRRTAHPLTEKIDLNTLRCAENVDRERAALGLGTLGGGNHFIEVDRDEDGFLYLIVHSGSRSLGAQTADHYKRLGRKAMSAVSDQAREELVARLTAEGRENEIGQGLEDLKDRLVITSDIPEKFSYVEGRDLEDYLHDMTIVQRFAALNREAMTRTIIEEMGLTEAERFTTVHNYIETDSGILRKGAVSARKGEKLLIPINMRDGALICVGKGNPEWNYSAPHGAGRLMSRTTARNTLTLERFREEMRGVYTTCVAENTLDESPMAYKGLDAILSQIGPTAEVVRRIMPVYNFKAGT